VRLLHVLVFTYPIKTMQQSCPWKEIPPKTHYRVHNSPVMDTILSQMNPIHNFTPHFFKIYLILFWNVRVGIPSRLFPSGFPTKILYIFQFYNPRPCHPPWFITVITFCEEEKLQSSSLCSLLQPPSYVQIFSLAPYSQAPHIALQENKYCKTCMLLKSYVLIFLLLQRLVTKLGQKITCFGLTSVSVQWSL